MPTPKKNQGRENVRKENGKSKSGKMSKGSTESPKNGESSNTNREGNTGK